MSNIVVQYGTTVADSAPEIRNAFVRKVYTILCEYQLSLRANAAA